MSGGFFSCFGRCGGPLVPPDHTELGRDELKSLFERSVSLNNGKLIVHGIFARADTKNNNKRVYPKYILKREVAKYEAAHILNGTALGELDHPNYASQYFKCLNLPNVSHQVLDVEWKGDQLWGTIEILQTPSGLLLWELYSQGIKLGVSSRGWASLRTDPKAKCVYVDDDFELITFDFVTEPSTKGAYLVPIRRTYRDPIPDQTKCTQIAHLGHGVVSMRSIPRLPDLSVLGTRVYELQARCPGAVVLSKAATQALPPMMSIDTAGYPTSFSQNKAGLLDQLLLFSHYIVFQQATYLEREPHARDYQSHLAMFSTRAHLADQQQIMNRADLNAIILREIAREDGKQGLDLEGKPGGGGPAVAASTPTASAAISVASGPAAKQLPYDTQNQQSAAYPGGPAQGQPISNGMLASSSIGGHLPLLQKQEGGMSHITSQGSGLQLTEQQQPQQGVAAGCDLGAWAYHPHAVDHPVEGPGAGQGLPGANQVLLDPGNRDGAAMQQGPLSPLPGAAASNSSGSLQPRKSSPRPPSSTTRGPWAGSGGQQPLQPLQPSAEQLPVSVAATHGKQHSYHSSLAHQQQQVPSSSVQQPWSTGMVSQWQGPYATVPVVGVTTGSGQGESMTREGSIADEVAAELQRVRNTLHMYSQKYMALHQHVQKSHHVPLPVAPPPALNLTQWL